MRFFKNHYRVLLLYLSIPFAFTKATKQRLRKKVRMILNQV